jgi:hypothetical protein
MRAGGLDACRAPIGRILGAHTLLSLACNALRYFLEPKSAIEADGDATIASAATEMETLKKKKETLEGKLAETEKELNEMAKLLRAA